jgi:hypothetical protein
MEKKWLKVVLNKDMDPALLERAESIFHNDNLTETILHAHLLIERALTSKIAAKLARPEIVSRGHWSFHQKVLLFIALFDPPEDVEKNLKAFNKLRNGIAHNLGDEFSLVDSCIPYPTGGPLDHLMKVRVAAMRLLYCDLDAFDEIGPLNRNSN